MAIDRKRWADKFCDDLAPIHVPEDIRCIDCLFRKEGFKGHTNAYCEMYDKEFGQSKPSGILWDHEDCEYYETDYRL